LLWSKQLIETLMACHLHIKQLLLSGRFSSRRLHINILQVLRTHAVKLALTALLEALRCHRPALLRCAGVGTWRARHKQTWSHTSQAF